jgi:hypothetical protein
MQRFGCFQGGSRHCATIANWSQLTDAVEKGFVIFGEQ